MQQSAKRRDFIAFVFSAAFHALFAAALVTAPERLREKYEVVDLSIERAKQKPEKAPEEELPEEEDEPEEKDKPKPKPKPKRKQVEEPPPPPPEQEEEPPPEEVKEEAPPVFDLGDNTFADNSGQGAGWSLNRSEGNTKLAAVAGKNKPSVRHTKPKVEKGGKPGGKGDVPVPLRDLSKRPMPKDGPPPPPPYPAEARRAGIEGPVILQVFITKTGQVKRVRVVKSPSDLLSREAKTAMLKVRWTPPLDKTGRPVDTVIVWTYRYVLDG